jgi:hypothetical protein
MADCGLEQRRQYRTVSPRRLRHRPRSSIPNPRPSIRAPHAAFRELWKTLKADSEVEEVVRNFFIRQPLLWVE